MEEDRADEITHLGASWGRRRDGGWPDLNPDILYQVMCRLPSIHDCLSLAAVCHHWRDAVYLRLPCSLPKLCLALLDGRFFTFQPGTSVLKRRDDLCRVSYHGATDSELITNGAGMHKLLNPISGRDRLVPVPYDETADEPPAEEDRWFEEMPLRKVVVCPEGLVAAIVGQERSAKVALCAAHSWAWSIDAAHDRWYADMAFYHGTLYALTNDGDLLAVKVAYEGGGQLVVSNIEAVIDGASCPYYALQEHTRMRYLVGRPHGGGLLMVCRMMLERGMSTYDFAVFRADLGSSRWVEVRTLGGDEALFVGRLCSRAVRADRHGVRGDQIFFLDDSPGTEELYLIDAFANVYDMKHGIISELLPMHSYGEAEVPPTWLFREDADAEE